MSVTMRLPSMCEEKYSRRRKSCNQYKANHKKIKAKQTYLGWMGRGSKLKEEDSGIEISSTESNDLEDIKGTNLYIFGSFHFSVKPPV